MIDLLKEAKKANKASVVISIIGLIIIGVISLASAITIYAGESYSFESEEFEYYTSVGNSSNMEGMNVTWENGNTTLAFDVRFGSDNFTLIFFNEKVVTNTITVGGGGGSRTVYRDRNVTIEVDNYIDREVEIEGEEKIVEKIVNPTISGWLWFSILAIIIIVIIYLVLKGKNKKESIPELPNSIESEGGGK